MKKLKSSSPLSLYSLFTSTPNPQNFQLKDYQFSSTTRLLDADFKGEKMKGDYGILSDAGIIWQQKEGIFFLRREDFERFRKIFP